MAVVADLAVVPNDQRPDVAKTTEAALDCVRQTVIVGANIRHGVQMTSMPHVFTLNVVGTFGHSSPGFALSCSRRHVARASCMDRLDVEVPFLSRECGTPSCSAHRLPIGVRCTHHKVKSCVGYDSKLTLTALPTRQPRCWNDRVERCSRLVCASDPSV